MKSVVQSLAATAASGRGAASAVSSMLLVPSRIRVAFSQMQPPCMLPDTITAGTAVATRSSIAASSRLCVPPPLAPLMPMRAGSTSGSVSRKSTARTAFHIESPRKLWSRSSASASVKPGAVLNRGAVGVADHVPRERDHAHPRQHRRPRLQRIACGLERLLAARRHGLFRLVDGDLLMPPARPVSVRRQHRGQAAAAAGRPIQVAGDPMARHALEGDVLDRVAVAHDLAADHRVQRRARGPRPQAQRDADLPAQRLGARHPLGLRGERRRERRRVIEVARGGDAAVVEAVAGVAHLPERPGGLRARNGHDAHADGRRHGERRNASCYFRHARL